MKDFSFDISILEQLPVAIGIADFEGNILFINKSFINLFGYAHNEIPTLNAWNLLAYPDAEYRKQVFDRWNIEIEQTIKTKEISKPDSLTVRCKDGNIKQIEISFNIKDKHLLLFFKDISRIVEAKENAINEKKFTDQIINSLPGAFYIYKKQGETFSLFRWNSNFEKVSGYSHEDLVGKSPFVFFTKKDAIIAQEAIKQVFEKGYAEVELSLINKDKTSVPYNLIGYPLRYGGNTYFIGQGIDISKQKENESNLQTLFKALHDIIIVTDYVGNVLFINESLTSQLGYSLSDLQDKSKNIKLHSAKDREIISQEIISLINSNKSNTNIIEHQVFDIKGQLHWYSGIISKTIYNGNPALLTITRNINKIKQSEIALIESEQRMSTIFDSAPVIMMLINEKREILQINKKGIKSLNYNLEEQDAIPFGDAYKCINTLETPKNCGHNEICKDCTIRNTIKDTFENGTEHIKVNATIQSKIQTYSILLSSYLLNTSNSKEVLLTIDDITKTKKIEEDLRKSKELAEENDRLKSAFLQNMSHEIRTPLNGILGFSSLLENKELSVEDRKYYNDVINQSSVQLLSIVDDILDLSRLETGQASIISEEVNINGIIEELFEKYNLKVKDKNLVLSKNTELNDKQSCIITDSDKLKQILNCLLSNALKFTADGHVLLGYRIENNFMEFYVEDTGIGIDKKFHNKIFERFRQVDSASTRIYGGTGLGLTIAKANVELLGGSVRLESELNTGSKFYFTIPYEPVYQEQVEDAVLVNSNKSSMEDITILVAEDEEINYLFIEESLRDLNYNLIHVYDGIEAIEECKRNKNIKLVLMDIKMPNMDGYTALKEIKKIRPDLPIIAQTAYAMISDKDKAIDAGFKAYLSKPIKIKDLMAAITSCL